MSKKHGKTRSLQKGIFISLYHITNPKGVVEVGLMRKFSGIFQPPYTNNRYRNMLRSMVGVKK